MVIAINISSSFVVQLRNLHPSTKEFMPLLSEYRICVPYHFRKNEKRIFMWRRGISRAHLYSGFLLQDLEHYLRATLVPGTSSHKTNSVLCGSCIY